MVMPHLVLVMHTADPTGSPEPERRGNTGQNRCRKRPAQSVKKASLAKTGRQSRHEIGDGGDPGSNCLHATA